MAATALRAVDNLHELLIAGIRLDVVEAYIGVERSEDDPLHLLRVGRIPDIGVSVSKFAVVIGSELRKHHIARVADPRIGRIVGPVMAKEHGVAGNVVRIAEADGRPRIDNAILAGLLVNVFVNVVHDVVGPEHRIVDIGAGDAEPALDVRVDLLVAGDVEEAAVPLHQLGVEGGGDAVQRGRGSARRGRAVRRQRIAGRLEIRTGNFGLALRIGASGGRIYYSDRRGAVLIAAGFLAAEQRNADADCRKENHQHKDADQDHRHR